MEYFWAPTMEPVKFETGDKSAAGHMFIVRTSHSVMEMIKDCPNELTCPPFDIVQMEMHADYIAAAENFEEDQNCKNISMKLASPMVVPLENFDNTEPEQSGSSTGIHSFVTPSHISPVPTIKTRTSNRGRKPARSVLISSSLYKKDLKNAQIKKSDNESRTQKKSFQGIVKKKITKKTKKRDMTDSDS
ncbi:hypothetical protein HHI36_000638 [Cryptolaemus montrouzieri]|uniref:Uncharacterized protein n=1 Tax=Cryptolaemus montrouzieri TaxID=559131 RepID=A0ABD2P5J7_9CUCU